MVRNQPTSEETCALAGCDATIVRRAGGGRPRLYCSDAHRAEARRRRLGPGVARAGGDPRVPGTSGAAGGVAGGDDGLEGVQRQLQEALGRLERLRTEPRVDARIAMIRAEATAEILVAQQAAADAARHAAAADDRLARERGEWRATLERLDREHAEHLRTLEELSGALDGARAELEGEILRHHTDAERADAMLQAQRAAQAALAAEAAAELDELRQRLAAVLEGVEQAEQRASRAEDLLSARTATTVELEVRAARAEEQSRHAATRLEEAREELVRLRNELAGERRHHRVVEAELRSRIAKPGGGEARSRRRSSELAPTVRSSR